MRYLLDTNILIFLISDSADDLSSEVSEILANFINILFVSSLSLVELIYLINSGKIQVEYKNRELLLNVLRNDFYIETLHTKDEHLQTYSQLEFIPNHKDQIDHFIISQAICEKMTLISSDRKFRDYIPQKLDFVFNKR